jgi:hypothetical protein
MFPLFSVSPNRNKIPRPPNLHLCRPQASRKSRWWPAAALVRNCMTWFELWQSDRCAFVGRFWVHDSHGSVPQRLHDRDIDVRPLPPGAWE